MSDSILTSIKKILGVTEDDTAFDADIIIFINGVFPTLTQLGIGPNESFAIADATATWDDFLGNDLNLNAVKTYVYLRVRLLFDPPTTSYVIGAYEKQITELEWRINNRREVELWVEQSS